MPSPLLPCPLASWTAAPAFSEDRAFLFPRERLGFALVLDAGAGFVYEVIFT